MKLSDAEWRIMNALWARHPATAREIKASLPADVDWAYTTLKTMLSRLVEKGAVREAMQGNTSVYEPILTRRKARYRALQGLINQAFEGAIGPLVHFLVEEQELSPRQRQELIQALRNSSRRSKND